MAKRITERHLEILVTRINVLTNSPLEYSDKTAEKFKANIGHYCLSGAYGGWELQRIVNNGGAVSIPLETGHISKRELFEQLNAFIKGLELAKGTK